jgi:GNAT superfamily N-acetyltransferase
VTDQTGENYDAEDLVEELSDPKVNAAVDTVGLWADGVMVAYGVVYWRKNLVDVDRLNTDSGVGGKWRRRGLGRALLTWMIERARELHDEHHPDVPEAELNAGAIITNVGAAALFTGLGFEECRYSFTLRRRFDGQLPVVEVPDGLRLVSFEPAYDEALRLVHNEVFLDHWGSTPKDEETWQVWVTRLSALLRQAEQAGFQRASLGVDGENPTGALGLYQRIGWLRSPAEAPAQQ